MKEENKLSKKKIKFLLSGIVPKIFKNFYLMLRYGCYVDLGADIRFLRNITIGKGTIIRKCKIYAQNKLDIGLKCKIEDDVIINTKTGKIILGNNVAINPMSVIYGNGDVIIGDNVAIAPGVKILKNHLIPPLTIKGKFKHITSKPTFIGTNCLIGADVVIMDGVTIGDCSVVGANSFVNKNIPSKVIAVGSPVKVIKKRNNNRKKNKGKKRKKK